MDLKLLEALEIVQTARWSRVPGLDRISTTDRRVTPAVLERLGLGKGAILGGNMIAMDGSLVEYNNICSKFRIIVSGRDDLIRMNLLGVSYPGSSSYSNFNRAK